MSAPRLRVTTSAGLKQRRFEELLAGRDQREGDLRETVLDAQALGSLELAGFSFAWSELESARVGGATAEEVRRMREAQRAVASGTPLDAPALLAWHAALTGSRAGFRGGERERPDGPPPAPPGFVAERVGSLAHWLQAKSGRELRPEQQGALALARVVEILPFDDGNGRVARLAASHVMEAAGARPPILVGGDRARLYACLAAAFKLDTQPLTSLLAEASERALDVMIQQLARPS